MANSKLKVGASRERKGLFLTLPTLVIMAITVFLPILWSLRLSFSKTNIKMTDMSFVGFKNYIHVLQSNDFLNVLLQTFGFVITTLFFEFVIGFVVAIVLNRSLPGTNLFKLLFTLPLIMAPVVSGLQWRWLFADQYGAINNILSLVGIKGPLWMVDPWAAKGAVLISNLWLAAPFVILVLLAAMSSLPEELYEAAKIDGAKSYQVFRYITLPLLKPAILLILVVRLADAFRVFDIVYILTQGGPGGSTEVLSTYIYKEVFTKLNFSEGAAASFIVMLIISIVSYFSFRLLRPKAGEM
ncbi:sugar ABC transporter permease [Lederbergia sp. NSJ-179]|uniref:carbohydrate ABC transporter permease n=1 Tax=Lederbergia sp. NSJ-179 TaxID=2931402 RepID=UPI001FD45CFF|nr:sugar ABC transporter permease [Lederbergia sp. NSJ-179]MCJ7840696.1 sugar ABC transporter permease [Lederbergia sp. NSJ-179]